MNCNKCGSDKLGIVIESLPRNAGIKGYVFCYMCDSRGPSVFVPYKRGGKFEPADEYAERFKMEAMRKWNRQLDGFEDHKAESVEEFLASGGEITKCPPLFKANEIRA